MTDNQDSSLVQAFRGQKILGRRQKQQYHRWSLALIAHHITLLEQRLTAGDQPVDDPGAEAFWQELMQ